MEPIYLTADRLYDGSGAAAMTRPQIRISGERIESVQSSLLPPAGCSGERFSPH